MFDEREGEGKRGTKGTAAPRSRKRILDRAVALDTVRRRLARDLHDHAGWHLVALNYSLFAVESNPGSVDEIRLLRTRLDDLNAALRELTSHFNGPDATGRQFVQDISDVCSQWTQITAIPVSVAVETSESEVSRRVSAVLIAVLREALTNIARHAPGTSCATVRLGSAWTGSVWLSVDDDARPTFEVAPGCGQPEGNGIRGMRERVQEVGGIFTRERNRAGGTRVFVQVPGKARP